MEPSEKISLSQRRKRINLEKLEPAQVEALGLELGKKLGKITETAQEKANKIAEIYGIKVRVAIQFVDPKTGEIIKA